MNERLIERKSLARLQEIRRACLDLLSGDALTPLGIESTQKKLREVEALIVKN